MPIRTSDMPHAGEVVYCGQPGFESVRIHCGKARWYLDKLIELADNAREHKTGDQHAEKQTTDPRPANRGANQASHGDAPGTRQQR